MQDLVQIFPHIFEKIFQQLDNASLLNCRLVNKVFQEFIDERNYAWIRIVNIPRVLQKRNSYLHVAAKTGQTKLFVIIANEEPDKNKKIIMEKHPCI